MLEIDARPRPDLESGRRREHEQPRCYSAGAEAPGPSWQVQTGSQEGSGIGPVERGGNLFPAEGIACAKLWRGENYGELP